MEWRGRRESRNIEDRRASGSRGAAVSGVGGIGVLAIVIIGYFLGIDVSPLLNGAGSIDLGSQQNVEITQEDQDAASFVSVTLADTEEIWAKKLKELGRTYHPATLVLFKGVTASPCGNASGATGPFYCPNDQKIYLDTDFFVTLERRLGAGGDFANAYVVAHEVAHHVQDELGILGKVNQVRQQVSQTESNQLSVMIELQADCFSGIWAREAAQTYGTIEPGDFEEAINAAKQIGDDTLQRNAGQRPMPESFTHGTSEQRSRWFQTGLKSGQVKSCDTFSAKRL